MTSAGHRSVQQIDLSKHDGGRDFLTAHPLFQGILPGSKYFQEFLLSVTIRKFRKNELIYTQSQVPGNLYLVFDGEVHIEHHDDQTDRTTLIGIEGRGNLFGEVSLLSEEPRTSNALAALDSQIIIIPERAFRRLLSGEPTVGETLARILSRRLRGFIDRTGAESPARVIVVLYPENEHRCSEISELLAHNLTLDNPAPVALCAFNRSSPFNKETGPNLTDIMERWPGITIDDIRDLIESPQRSFSILRGDLLHAREVRYEKMTESIPALLGSLRKYFSCILIDAGSDYEHPVIARIISQCDHIVLIRNLRSTAPPSEKNHEIWKRGVKACIDLKNNFFDQVVTASDETADIDRLELNRTINRYSALYRQHIRLQSKYHDRVGSEDPYFRRGIGRLARRVSGTMRGLCLGGGGARAFAHVGALQVLEEATIDFDMVIGTSMGAIIGAGHAQGLNASEIRETIKSILPSKAAVLDSTIPLISFFRGKKLNQALQNAFGDMKFEDLDLPFFCNGSDLNSGRSIIFERGYVTTALRASVSLPGIFPPLKLKDRIIVDGGVLNNLPGNVLKERGCSHILGMNVMPLEDIQSGQTEIDTTRGVVAGLLDYIRVPPILRIVYRSITIEGRELLKFRMEDFDYIINPDVSGVDIFDFHLCEQIMERGRLKTEECLPEIKETMTRKKFSERIVSPSEYTYTE